MSKPDGHPPRTEKTPESVKLVKTRELRPDGQTGACLRPLGLCELGGCCDVCWYGGARPEGTESDRP